MTSEKLIASSHSYLIVRSGGSVIKHLVDSLVQRDMKSGECPACTAITSVVLEELTEQACDALKMVGWLVSSCRCFFWPGRCVFW